MSAIQTVGYANAVRVLSGDIFTIETRSSATNLVLTVNIWFIDDSGKLQSMQFISPPTSTMRTDRALNSDSIQNTFGNGTLIAAHVETRLGQTVPVIGQCWCRLYLARGVDSPNSIVRTLDYGYIAKSFSLDYPDGQKRGPTDGPGQIRSVNITNPAVATDFSASVPSGARWRPRSIKATLAADANAANRNVQIIVQDASTNSLWYGAQGPNQTANQTKKYNWSANYPVEDSTFGSLSSDIRAAFPNDLILGASWSLVSNTSNLQVGDQWSSIYLEVEEWIDP